MQRGVTFLRASILDSLSTSKTVSCDLEKKRSSLLPLTCGALLYALLSLFTITPITNMTGTPAHWWLSKVPYWFGRWLPVDLHLANNSYISRQNTGYLELMLLLLTLFVLYSLCAFVVYRLHLSDRRIFGLIWLTTV